MTSTGAEMSVLKIEVFETRDEALERADYFRQRGFAITPPVEHDLVAWSNNTHGGKDDTASDPTDGKVWIVQASR